MSNLTSTLITTAIAFAQQQFQTQSKCSIPEEILPGIDDSLNTKDYFNNSMTTHSGNDHLLIDPSLGTSVAFPGNPLTAGQVPIQNYLRQTSHPQLIKRDYCEVDLEDFHMELNPNQTRNLLVPNTTNMMTPNNSATIAKYPNAASWPCPACKIAFRSPSELQTHLSVHFVPTQKQIQSQFTSLINLNANTINNSMINVTATKDKNIHIKEDISKSVPCTECGKFFASAKKLRVHFRVAHGEKTCSCEICGCGFSYRSKLINHMRSHTGDKPFTCEVCGRGFSQKNHLKRHNMIHTGERPFLCEVCGRSFYRKDKLTRHIRIHTNPNPGRARGGKMTVTANPTPVPLPPNIQMIPVMTTIKTSTSTISATVDEHC